MVDNLPTEVWHEKVMKNETLKADAGLPCVDWYHEAKKKTAWFNFNWVYLFLEIFSFLFVSSRAVGVECSCCWPRMIYEWKDAEINIWIPSLEFSVDFQYISVLEYRRKLPPDPQYCAPCNKTVVLELKQWIMYLWRLVPNEIVTRSCIGVSLPIADNVQSQNLLIIHFLMATQGA